MTVYCKTCGDGLTPERADLGYDYCLKADCQRANRQGPTVIAYSVNKSADSFVIDSPDARRRAAAGEMGKKNATLGSTTLESAPTRSVKPPERRSGSVVRPTRVASRPWTANQEKYVRARIALGATPRQIALESGRLQISVSLATMIACSPPKRG